MDIQNYKNFLMSVIPSAKPASGGKFINCRCFNCPDSADPSHRHMYIKIPENQNEPSWYYCHLCHSSGVITHKTLIQWNIYNETVAIDLIEHNKKCSKSKKNIKFYDREIYRINNTYTSENDNTAIKLKFDGGYFDDGTPFVPREGSEFSIAEWIQQDVLVEHWEEEEPEDLNF